MESAIDCVDHLRMREVVEFPPLEISKRQLDVVLGNLLWVALLEQGVGQMTSRGPFQPQPLWDSVMTNGRSTRAGKMVL